MILHNLADSKYFGLILIGGIYYRVVSNTIILTV